MNNYIDYTYYSETFGGVKIPQEDFNKYSAEASNKVRLRILLANLDSLNEEETNAVKNATCQVAELLYDRNLIKSNIASGTANVVTSEKVGDYSRTLGNLSVKELAESISEETIDKKINDILFDTLVFYNLLNCGVYNV